MISKDRLGQMAAFAPVLERTTYPLTSAELLELLQVYLRAHYSGAGPARGTLEHRIEELEGTVAELAKNQPAEFLSIATDQHCGRCGKLWNDHTRDARGRMWCPP